MKKQLRDDREWIEAFRRRDEKALAYLFDLNYKSLRYFANGLINDEEEAEDIVSGCFVKLWKSEREVESLESVKSFLYIACRNACLDHLRTIKVRSVNQQKYYDQLESFDETIFVNIVKTEVLDSLEKEIELLPPKCKEVFRLFYFENKKTPEVMEILSLNEKAVRYQKAKAIDILRNSMLKKGLKEGFALALLLFLNNR